MNRRHFLQQAGATAALGLAGCTPRLKPSASTQQAPTLYTPIAPINAQTDRLFRITVCLRPFRAIGPRLDTEQIAGKLVVHNYGHGGSGWSLSWGSSTIAIQKALSNGDRDVAVIGCGALGLTSATLLQRAGARVTIYAKDRPPDVRSSRATGSWTPDSRIALAKDAPATFPAQWEQMARTSWAMYQSYLGMPGNPVEYTDRYNLWDGEDGPRGTPEPSDPGFLYLNDRIHDLAHAAEELSPEANPFPTKHCSRVTRLQFNVADYSRQLVNDFLIAGGKLEPAEFHQPSDLAGLPQKAIINCTGYGARALFKDESITPVRGQIGWLIPQTEVNYGLTYGNLNVLSRRDGIVVQASEQGEASGWNDSNEQPDQREAETAVKALADLYARMKQPARRA
ncbi:FAD-dependent oxidoreductase [Granulicella sibirica]|uniref:D-amino-acid oxidase n=1 Tax=Granulicella sibirica TaxID=2479048 RepID=A0A4Q0T7V8_9BACT|nr:FAD-dependent oxidoreductase [Granulicella sibirica]RXH57786.1 D-amino acid oxidase [Granulicella sibirica]